MILKDHAASGQSRGDALADALPTPGGLGDAAAIVTFRISAVCSVTVLEASAWLPPAVFNVSVAVLTIAVPAGVAARTGDSATIPAPKMAKGAAIDPTR